MSENDAPRAAPRLPVWRVERILYDKDGLLVVDKPAGLPVHGGDEELEDDCVSRLGAWLRAQGRPSELYVHQRLDQATSGVLFFLTDPSRNAEFAHAMQEHAIERRYLAVVETASSARADREGALRSALVRGGAQAGRGARPSDPKTSSPAPTSSSRFHEGPVELHLSFERGRAQVVPAHAPGAKHAVTQLRIVERRGARALLEVTLRTGRPHQIRATLAHLGTPVVGDVLYGGAPHERVLLHAASISGGPLPHVFEAPVPGEFVEALSGAYAPERRQAGPELALDRLARAPAELKERVLDAAMLRARLRDHTSAFRLFNGAPDGLPGCTIDVYGPWATINPYSAGFDRDALVLLAQTLGELGFRGVYVKQRVRADLRKQSADELAPNRPLWGEAAPDSFVIDEHGMKLSIELHDGLSTGLFVDMREARKKLRAWTAEYSAPRMLNLFCYTCSFSVAAALGGAHTTSVDLAGRALVRGRRNFELNGLDPAAHRFFKEDALKFLSKSARRGDRYELIVLDPPSFATVGKSTFSVSGQYGQAARDCFSLLAPGGRLLAVTNHHKTSPRAFLKTVERAAELAGQSASVRTLAAARDCPDHATGPFPSKAVLARVQ